MKNSISYVEMINQPTLSLKTHLKNSAYSHGKLRSMNSVYLRDLKAAQADLADYFNRSLHRPFNCLLLGPPGSGKSTIAKQLAEFGGSRKAGGLLPTHDDKRDPIEKAKVLEFNLSQLHDSGELVKLFDEIARAKNEPKIVLLDEFDVRVGSSSVIRYLIEAMYDGKILGTHEFGKTAFIFSGSYLSDKDILGRIQKEKSQIDLPRFIFEYSYRVANINGDTKLKEEVESLFHMCEVYRRYQEEASPESHAIIYLRQLDKLTDFLSRINGFVIEIPNLATPLEVTDPPGVLLTKSRPFGDLAKSICARSRGVAERVIEWTEEESKIERGDEDLEESHRIPPINEIYQDGGSTAEPVLRYKDMLIKERARIFLTIFDYERKNRREKREPRDGRKWTNDTVVFMKRNLLNYLCTVPLIHGMRSLNTLMWNLDAKDGTPERGKNEYYDEEGREQYTLALGDADKVMRHVRQEGDYVDPLRLWELIKRENDLPIDGDSYIRLILDDEDGKLRVWDDTR